MMLTHVFGYISAVCCTCVAIKLDVFSTRTIYKWSHDAVVNTPVVENAEFSFTNGNQVCEAKHVYLVARHGARYPSASTVGNILEMVEKVVKNKDQNVANFTWLESWSSRYNDGNMGRLVQEGIDEQIDLGKRYGRRFKSLFQPESRVKFISSYQTRATNSSKYFHEGISAETNNSFGGFENEINNKLTRFFDKCHNYVTQVSKNATHMAEFTKYEETPEFRGVGNSIEERLGLKANLTASEIYLINILCTHELYIFGEESWCSLLNDEEREILEYGKDIQKFYQKGDTYPMIKKIVCPLFEDALNTLMESKNANILHSVSGKTDSARTRDLSGKFIFGHETTTLALLTVLGLYKDDEKLMATNRATMKNRQFRTSHTTPYTANVAFVLYACNGTGQMDTASFHLKLFVNEKAVVIPACNKFVCNYEEFMAYYRPSVENCDLAQICGQGNEYSRASRNLGCSFPTLPFLILLACKGTDVITRITIMCKLCLRLMNKLQRKQPKG